MGRTLVALLLLAPGAIGAAPGAALPSVELERLLIQDCGSCHGLHLSGGLGPPITAERMRRRPLAWLRRVIAEGVPGTAMPPWRGPLSDGDIAWLARRLQSAAPRSDRQGD